jgi:hypothetical protein
MIDRWVVDLEKDIFLDDDPKYFRIILLYLRDNVVEESDVDKNILMNKFEYYVSYAINEELIRDVFDIKDLTFEEQNNRISDISTIRFTNMSMISLPIKFVDFCNIECLSLSSKLYSMITEKKTNPIATSENNYINYSSQFRRLIRNEVLGTSLTSKLAIIKFDDSYITIVCNKFIIIVNNVETNFDLMETDKYTIKKNNYFYTLSIMTHCLDETINL